LGIGADDGRVSPLGGSMRGNDGSLKSICWLDQLTRHLRVGRILSGAVDFVNPLHARQVARTAKAWQLGRNCLAQDFGSLNIYRNESHKNTGFFK
jgi:hypothetical protein